ncbi:hypothetical protein JX265_002904 [Neoarthrinium moseri]|uniref:Uncharacterized protein n=1 Tax=Neoarthrinium moseri TaxID=1658444 RepID=A0A9Q0ATK0_9PEZI|nr:hypothetical protein JX265_002904 [Neoarthrinium moseri]
MKDYHIQAQGVQISPQPMSDRQALRKEVGLPIIAIRRYFNNIASFSTLLPKAGFGVLLSLLAMFIIHANFSYPTVSGWLPDPFFRVFTERTHKDKHGRNTGSYDTEGRFIPQRFEDIFSKYAGGCDYITLDDVYQLHKGQRLIMDHIGWFANIFASPLDGSSKLQLEFPELGI